MYSLLILEIKVGKIVWFNFSKDVSWTIWIYGVSRAGCTDIRKRGSNVDPTLLYNAKPACDSSTLFSSSPLWYISMCVSLIIYITLFMKKKNDFLKTNQPMNFVLATRGKTKHIEKESFTILRKLYPTTKIKKITSNIYTM